MFAAWISFRDGPTNPVFKILIQRFYKGLFHARVGFTNLAIGKRIWASTHTNDEPVLRKLTDAPVITDHIKDPEEVFPNLGHAFQVSLLSYIQANAGAVLPAHFPNEFKSIIAEFLIHGLVNATKASHVAGYGPLILLLNRQSFELEFLG